MSADSRSTIMHIDMNAFFASVEQTANPFIRYKPVAVGSTGKYDNTALLAVSYEAKIKGVKNLSRLIDARLKCPELIVVPFDLLKYYSVNQQIVHILQEYSPSVEVYSIDEAFIDLRTIMHLREQPAEVIAQEIKDRIRAEVGIKLTSSVGIAPNKLLAKVGSDWKKPDGMTVINWEDRLTYLDQLNLQDIWGIGYSATNKLYPVGIHHTNQLREIEDYVLRGLVGSYYTRLKLIANGDYYEPVSPWKNDRPQKSMQHAHTLSKATSDPIELLSIIRKMAERLARRLRNHEQTARLIYVGLKPANQGHYGWGSSARYSGVRVLEFGNNNGKVFYDQCKEVFGEFDFDHQQIRQVVVGVHNLNTSATVPFDIFDQPQVRQLDKAIDKINHTFGEFTIRTADILHQKAKESELQVARVNMTFHPAA